MKKILIVGPSWVGDMVMAQSLFKVLKQRHECEIDVIAPDWSLSILDRMPEVANKITMPLGHGELQMGKRWKLGQQMASLAHDQAIVLPNSFKSAIIPMGAGIPQRTGFRGEMRFGLINDMRMLSRYRLPMTVQRFVTLGMPINSPLPDPIPQPHLLPDAENQKRLTDELGLDAAQPAIAFMPGAEYGPAKQWPLEHFAALARMLAQRGRQIWILGSPKDAAAAERIMKEAGDAGVHNLCGKTGLGDAVDLLGLAEGSVTNDSGLMHVAAALDKPLVALFGSSSPEHTPPLSDKAIVRYTGIECSPCFKRECPLKHKRCLTEITPESVLQSLEEAGAARSAQATTES